MLSLMRPTETLLAALVPLLGACSTPPAPAEKYTAPIKETKGFFILYGDTREQDPRESVWRPGDPKARQLLAVRLAEEDPDFILSTGDLVRTGADRSLWERFDRENAAIREHGIAYYPSLGNHDYAGDEKEALSNYFEHFPLLEGRKWYDLHYKGLTLLVLDSNEDALADYERELEAKWLEAELAKADADPAVKWVIVTSHHTPYTNAVLFSDSLWVQETFLARAKTCKKFKAYVAGHVHSYERFKIDGYDFVVSGGGGAPLNSVSGKKGKHADLYDGPRQFHYLRFHVGDDIRVETVMVDDDEHWNVVDRFTIS
jgi:3',5'-cyclic AMP phosphodiesterase CpdA